MIEVQLEDLILIVDSETAENLKDPNHAASYLNMVRRQLGRQEQDNNLPNALSASESPSLWKSSKCPTLKDHEATLELLQIRKELHCKFGDKKTPNAELWQHIANHLNSKGFFVGERLEGREKVRQKFANLQASYIKYCDRRRQTGEGNVKAPKYYKELDLIFGDTHKAHPVLLIDSTLESNEDTHYDDAPTPSTSKMESTPATPKLTPTNCFQHVKRTLKPKTATRTALEEVVNIQRENQAQRKKDFDQMAELIRNESRQRHEQMMALIKQMGQKKSNSVKRMREDSSDEEN